MAILFKGQESTKKVDSQTRKTAPFAGTDRDGEHSSMGVGLLFPEQNNSYIWGLALPHDIVASYRGMKIAEEVPEFGHGTLCACWYAGHMDVHPSEKKYIDDIEYMIGKGKRLKILSEPLPSFDEAIKTMQEKKIDFEAWPFLTEIEEGNLAMTPVLEQVITDYSDQVLLFRGLSGDFEKAYKALIEKPKGFLTMLKKRGINESANVYVTMFERMLPELVPDLERQYWLLVKNIGENLDISQFDKHSKSQVEEAKSKIYEKKTEFDKASASMRQALASELPPEKKFIAYHSALETMVKSASDIASGFSTMEIYAGRREPSGDIYGATKSLAKDVVKVINRAAREHMKGAYALK